MKKITALEFEEGRKRQVRVFLDERSAFGLEAEIVLKEGLFVGRELTDAELSRLLSGNQYQKCLNAALHFLSFRPRSEFEVRARLKRRGFAEDDINSALEKLGENNLIDDAAFAEFWRESRENFSPRSQRLTAVELARKGVAPSIISAAVTGIDDAESAYRAASAKAKRIPRDDFLTFRNRLGGYLRRRGFNYEVIKVTIEKLWQEMGEASH